jgi:hypothetical protein
VNFRDEQWGAGVVGVKESSWGRGSRIVVFFFVCRCAISKYSK